MNRSAVLPVLIVALTGFGTACGGSDGTAEPSDADTAGDISSDQVATENESDGDAPQSPPTSGDGTATMTLDDGTVYEFVMSTCDTSDTDPSTFLVDPGFDAFGRSSDGFTLQLIRAAFEESPELQPVVGFEGRYDENGVNPEIAYIREGDATFQIDGGRIFGEATLKDFFSVDPIHGDGFTAAIEVDC